MFLQNQKGDLYDESKSGIKTGVEKSTFIYDCTWRGYWYRTFLRSGYTIHEAGPGGALVAYLVGGFVMYLTMLCLGELAVAMPDAGSYQTYATNHISPAVGYVVGWMSWLNWSATIGIELIAVSILMKRWFPDVSSWIWCVVFAVLLLLLMHYPHGVLQRLSFGLQVLK